MSLRNQLLGLPLDLGVLNIARGRSEGVAPLNEVRRQLFDCTGSSAARAVSPAGSTSASTSSTRSRWSNFIAAYGTHPTVDQRDHDR